MSTISGYETGLKIDQQVNPADSKLNTAYIERIRLTGNAVGIDVGNGSIVQGSVVNDDSTVTSGNGVIYPGAPQSFFLYDQDPGGSLVGPYPNTMKSGDVALGSSSTFAPLVTGDTGTTTIFDFSQAQTFKAGFLPPEPDNGIYPVQNGTTYGFTGPGSITQDGSGDGTLKISGAVNGPLQMVFGTNSHVNPNSPDPNNPNYILDPIDISNRNTVELVAKVGATNQSSAFLFALSDIQGNLAVWTVSMTDMNTTDYTTISFNLSGLAIPLNLGGSGNFDLSKVVGYAILGDEGLLNGQLNVPFDLEINTIQAGSVRNSTLQATGSVDLGGAKFSGSLRTDYVSAPSQTYIIIDNDGTADPVVGTFAGLTEGATVQIGTEDFTISYHGGDGNDVELTDVGVHVDNGHENLVIGQNIFYNGSKFDGSSAAVNDSDDLAIATDKTAYKAGDGVIGPSAMTSYAFGINGIMVDVVDGTAFENNPDAFTFKVATSGNDPSTWATAPAPSTVHVRTGKGADYMGTPTDRVEIIWDNFKITNQYLQVTVRGDDAVGSNYGVTDLAASDVFYYGNIVADAFIGEPAGAFSVNTSDEIGARTGGGFLLPVTNVYDFNKDTIVNTSDEVLARTHTAFLLRINIPAAGPLAAPAAVADDGSGSGVASALAVDATPATGPRLPGWISSRLAKVDLNSGPVANLFRHLAEADTPRSRAILAGADRIADALGLDDTLLDSLINDTDDDTSVG